MQSASNHSKAVIYLEDGTILKGKAFGYHGTVGGELCFNTGMTGYQEVFTDPSYSGQVLIMNTAYVGNYGINEVDVESDSMKIKALICKNLTERYSRFQAIDSLSQYLIKNQIIGVHDVDTRSLVGHIRNKGAMNCIVSTELEDPTELKKALEQIPQMTGLDLSSQVTTKEAYTSGDENAPYRVSILDFGVKKSMLDNMNQRGIFVKVFPADSTLEDLQSFNPDGFFISNGPGDPGAMENAVKTVKDMFSTGKPMFGICLGHQLMARAHGIGTFKMHHGHRGLNHPVRNLITGKSEITTQNHGFGVVPEDVAANKDVTISHINLNDDSIEGLKYNLHPAFSVQYHPESTPGPHDSRYLFDDFIELLKQTK